MSLNKPVLRNALKKLRRVTFERSDHANAAMAPQEMLDFLAMLASIKPVCLVGRGLDDPDWVAGVGTVAQAPDAGGLPAPARGALNRHAEGTT